VERLPDLEQLELQAFLGRALSLPYRSQLALHEQLTARLREAGLPPTKHDDLITRQRAALAAMQAVASELGLPKGQSPTTAEFAAETKRLGIKMSVSSAGRAFNGWGNATATFEGERLPESARVIRQRRSLQGAQSGSPGDHLELIAKWLASDECSEETRPDYEQWRRRYNESIARTTARTAVGWKHVTRVFPELTDEDIIAAARREAKDWVALCRQRAQERLRDFPNPLRLVTVGTAAALIGTTQYLARDGEHNEPNFPTAVAHLGRESLFIADDVIAYAAEKKSPARRRGELNGRLLTSTDVAKHFGVGRGVVDDSMRRQRFIRVPPPSGRTRRMSYRIREEVEAWERERAAADRSR
jgi:hypothetical protein